MSVNLPYMQAYGFISKVLEKIIPASTPPRFTQDYLSTKLGITSKSARPVIPFLKRIGFLGTDGSPTELYTQFRNSSCRGQAAAKALKEGYAPLYESNEYAHALGDSELKELIVQITGLETNSKNVNAIACSFKAINEYADFEGNDSDNLDNAVSESPASQPDLQNNLTANLGLSYTINLNLPATSDISVFDAIFKSLKENLLK